MDASGSLRDSDEDEDEAEAEAEAVENPPPEPAPKPKKPRGRKGPPAGSSTSVPAPPTAEKKTKTPREPPVAGPSGANRTPSPPPQPQPEPEPESGKGKKGKAKAKGKGKAKDKETPPQRAPSPPAMDVDDPPPQEAPAGEYTETLFRTFACYDNLSFAGPSAATDLPSREAIDNMDPRERGIWTKNLKKRVKKARLPPEELAQIKDCQAYLASKKAAKNKPQRDRTKQFKSAEIVPTSEDEVAPAEPSFSGAAEVARRLRQDVQDLQRKAAQCQVADEDDDDAVMRRIDLAMGGDHLTDPDGDDNVMNVDPREPEASLPQCSPKAAHPDERKNKRHKTSRA